MTSIWNDISPYGSSVSMKSAFNNVASKPPLIVYNGEVIGYLTTNNIKNNSLHPKYLYSWLQNNGF
jgi:hydroxymethylpyrimidine pyrophosphatase-like HAD family hydrolase